MCLHDRMGVREREDIRNYFHVKNAFFMLTRMEITPGGSRNLHNDPKIDTDFSQEFRKEKWKFLFVGR